MKMGCPKLPYHNNFSTLKVAYSNNLEVQNPAREIFNFTRKSSAGTYRYGFNGMEKDDEVKGQSNSYDYGARMYDNRLGRWLSPDPLTATQPSWSPYKMAKDNPILFMDPDGNAEIITIKVINKQTGITTTHSAQISERVKVRMNIQTAHPYYHDIEHTYVLTIEKDGSESVRSYFNQSGDKRGSVFSSTPWSYRTDNFEPFGFYLTSKNGEGTNLKSKNVLGSGDIDAMMSLITALSSIQGDPSKKLKETAQKLTGSASAVEDKLANDPVDDNDGYSPETPDHRKGRTIYGTEHITNSETGLSTRGMTITNDSVTRKNSKGEYVHVQTNDFVNGKTDEKGVPVKRSRLK